VEAEGRMFSAEISRQWNWSMKMLFHNMTKPLCYKTTLGKKSSTEKR